MSNEEVVLQMVAHRLEQLLTDYPELQGKFGPELTEVLNLAKGVIREATPAPARPVGPYGMMDDGRIWVAFDEEELAHTRETLGNTTAGRVNNRIWGRLQDAEVEFFGEPTDNEPDDNDDEEPVEEAGVADHYPHAGVDFATPPETLADQINRFRVDMGIREMFNV